MPYRVLIVDDQVVPRQLFQAIIAATDLYEIVDMIDTASVADTYCARGDVDLVLMDVVMKDGSNGLDHRRHVHAGRRHPSPRPGDRRGFLLV